MRKLDTITLLNDALYYIEKNLLLDLNIDDISKIACFSRYHFQRIFYALTGFTVTQYIKNRRLSLAAEEIASTDKRIIDIAIKYGYENPEAFSKAFKRLHGISPSALKRNEGKMKAFPKISFIISIKGENELIYSIVQKESFNIFGAELIIGAYKEAAYEEIPKFINKIYENGIYDKINRIIGKPKGTLLHGYHYDFHEDGTRKYIMGSEINNNIISDEFTILKIPKLTWAVFEGNGTKPSNLSIQNLWKRIYLEWFPSSNFQQAEGPCIENNYWNEEKNMYTFKVWIPIKRK